MTYDQIVNSKEFLEIGKDRMEAYLKWERNRESPFESIKKMAFISTVEEYIHRVCERKIDIDVGNRETFRALMRLCEHLSWETYDDAHTELLQSLIDALGHGDYLHD